MPVQQGIDGNSNDGVLHEKVEKGSSWADEVDSQNAAVDEQTFSSEPGVGQQLVVPRSSKDLVIHNSFDDPAAEERPVTTSVPPKRTFNRRIIPPVNELHRSGRLHSHDIEVSPSTEVLKEHLAPYVLKEPDSRTEVSRNILRNHIQVFKPEVLGIIEPRVKFDKISRNYWSSMGLVPLAQNDRGARSSNIWVFLGVQVVASVLHSSEQCVLISIKNKIFSGMMAVVHGSPSYIKRQSLWADLAMLQGIFIILGDFNAVRGSHERRGKAKSSPQACFDFNNFIGDSDLFEVERNGLFFSWSRRRFFPELTESKIDRALISKAFQEVWALISATLLPHLCSDHSPLVVVFKSLMDSGPIPFRFWHMWTGHESFLALVRDSWMRHVESGSKIRLVMLKLKRLKGELKVWNTNVFGNFNVKIKDLQARLLEVQDDISRYGYSDARLNDEIAMQAEINGLLLVQSSHLQQKSRVDWLNDGDRNTKFFHDSMRRRRAKASIELFATNGEPIPDYLLIDQLLPKLVSEQQACGLIQMLSFEEIRLAVFDLDPNSAASPDGFSGKFFHVAWDVIASDIYKAILEFFEHGVIPPGLNSGFLVLLPKKECALRVEEFRLIALSNFLFNIFTKILATRLNKVAATFVSNSQYGFIQGRQIHEAIVLASEGINALNRTHEGRNMAFKLEITKAFDTMEWPFIQRVLRNFGFPQQFCNWIQNILTSARLFILINGQVCSRGKSKVFYGGGVRSRVRKFFSSRLGFNVGSFPTDYLGVLIFQGMPRVQHIQRLADKILAKFDRWNAKMLSMAGRLCLIKSVIVSSAIHSMMVYAWLASLVHKLDTAVQNFLWKCDINERSYTAETVDHLFWSCSLASIVWQWVLDVFQVDWHPTSSFHEAFIYFTSCSFGSQLSALWKAAIITVVWAIWTFRNKAIYEDLVPTPFVLINIVRVALKEMSFMRGSRGYMRNTVHELITLKALKVDPRPAPLRTMISVMWHPPPPSWIEINTDGAFQGALGLMTTGGVFRRANGDVFDCFHTAEGVGFTFLAELLAVLVALEWVQKLSLNFIWLEADSVYVSLFSLLGVYRFLGW
ncbi:hypothetical protein C2S52_019747 [Perilla frutescens var. hirtella]|nr:hypothetical protein C2S52_019747 [Perilla frutescens var. hirtella]